MEKQTPVKAEEFGIETKQAEGIEAAFAPKIAERKQLNKIYTELIKKEITPETCQEAGELRKKLVKVRTGIGSIHKTQKQFFLAAGRFVDAWKNKETEPVEQMEEVLLKLEKHYEFIEAEKAKKIEEDRTAEVRKYIAEGEHSGIPSGLGSMDDTVFEMYLKGIKEKHEKKQAEAAEAEKKRIAEQKELQLHESRVESLMPYFNILKLPFNVNYGKLSEEEFNEKIEEGKALLKKNEEEAAENKRKAEKLQKEADEAAKIQKKKDDEAKKKLEAERKEKERIQKELDDKKAAEEEAEKKKKAEEQLELMKGDAAKVTDLINDLVSVKTKYAFKSAKNKKMYEDVHTLIDKVIAHIK